MLATPEGRAVHVVCSPKADYLAVIRADVPEPAHCHPSAAAALGAPAWVCTQCGEPLFEGREVDVIQNTIKALDLENEKLLVDR